MALFSALSTSARQTALGRVLRHAALPATLIGVAALWLGGCATYTDHLSEAKQQVINHKPKQAVEKLNEALKTPEAKDLPAKMKGNNTLWLLERATVLQALGMYRLAARDMMICDQELDWLDIAAEDKAKLGKYMFSGTSVKYRAPPYERLMLNTLNMLNFLALRDFEGAQVEARRFRIIETFFTEDEGKTLLPGLLGFGNYMSGVAFEAGGDYRTAARKYAKAWHHGVRHDGFRRRLVELMRMTGNFASGYRDSLQSARSLDSVVADARGGEPMTFRDYRQTYVDGNLLTVVQTGMVPYKKGKRYAIAEALAYTASASYYAGFTLSTSQRSTARRLAASGVLNTVNFPVLTDNGLPSTRSVSLDIGRDSAHVIHGLNVSKQVRHAWERIAPALMVAAITRMITRAAAGTAVGTATEAATESEVAGLLAQATTQLTMSAFDTPDTRSWSLLPGNIWIARRQLQPGSHSVEVRVSGKTRTKSVEIAERGPTIVNFSALR